MATLAEHERRVPHPQFNAMLRDAIAMSGEPALGLLAALCEQPGDFHVLEHVATKCASVGEALRLVVRFAALMNDGIALELDVAAPLAALRVRPLSGTAFERAAIEFLFASLLVCGSSFVGHPMPALRVEFAHASPPDTALYEQTFREARFGCREHVMWFTASTLAVPHCAPDRSLVEMLTDQADRLLRQLPPRSAPFSERTRAAIAETLAFGSGAKHVAHRLAVSLRTLHRRLAEEGTCHRELVDEVRRTQAVLHLSANRSSIEEIASVLGFSHPNAFHKAFKRWMRMTPARYRDQAQVLSDSADVRY